MPDPKALKQYPLGVRLAPAAIDVIPSDWATVNYVASIAEHPDLPGVPIIRWRTVASVVGDVFITEDGETVTEDGDILTEP